MTASPASLSVLALARRTRNFQFMGVTVMSPAALVMVGVWSE